MLYKLKHCSSLRLLKLRRAVALMLACGLMSLLWASAGCHSRRSGGLLDFQGTFIGQLKASDTAVRRAVEQTFDDMGLEMIESERLAMGSMRLVSRDARDARITVVITPKGRETQVAINVSRGKQEKLSNEIFSRVRARAGRAAYRPAAGPPADAAVIRVETLPVPSEADISENAAEVSIPDAEITGEMDASPDVAPGTQVTPDLLETTNESPEASEAFGD